MDGPLARQSKPDQIIWYPSIRRPILRDSLIWDVTQIDVHTIQDRGENSIIQHDK